MKTKDMVNFVLDTLENKYPDAICSLDYDRREPYQLLIAVRLSAQCTDARVNIVCRDLFARYKTLEEIAACDIEDLYKIVQSCGFYRVKAQNIKETANILVTKYHGVIPESMEELLTLPGVGRKSANLIRGDIYKKPAIVADTHCIRISNRLGFVKTTDPAKVEVGLVKLIPPEKSSDFCHRLVLFGREFCTARAPKCELCPIAEHCPSKKL